VLPRRWVVDRTFSWFRRNRRLAKDFENLAETQQATGLHRTMVKVCKPDGERTIAGTRGNGEDAP
jgi:transposase